MRRERIEAVSSTSFVMMEYKINLQQIILKYILIKLIILIQTVSGFKYSIRLRLRHTGYSFP
jgi:hypothetical protein